MYDCLTIGDLPDPERENASLVYKEVIDSIRSHALTNPDASKLLSVLRSPHVKVGKDFVEIEIEFYFQKGHSPI